MDTAFPQQVFEESFQYDAMGNVTQLYRAQDGYTLNDMDISYSGNRIASAARLSRAAARGILRISKMRFLRRGTACVGSFYYLCADREKIWPRSLAE